ncbi:Protein of unknown function [Devosia enhydra]|uniref:DUF2442 domain-containing protein n=1 Tax=Devosia enhydra TaxID=665118 RepID=A0A1K2I0G6_9HYPH|nr:DUF2442 domain-containing protein [Devosia enhydra]SFZ85885.1 Protein of unknown function [Devosia enhydra]
MNSLVLDTEPVAIDVTVEADVLRVVLGDGRQISVPIEWFPRLRDATATARADWRLLGGGVGIHWPQIDEDISIKGLLAGRGARNRAA